MLSRSALVVGSAGLARESPCTCQTIRSAPARGQGDPVGVGADDISSVDDSRRPPAPGPCRATPESWRRSEREGGATNGFMTRSKLRPSSLPAARSSTSAAIVRRSENRLRRAERSARRIRALLRKSAGRTAAMRSSTEPGAGKPTLRRGRWRSPAPPRRGRTGRRAGLHCEAHVIR